MANVLIDSSNLSNIASAIRSKNGTETQYKPSEMASAVRAIQTFKPEETFDVTPTTSQQTITPSTGHVFSGGTVQAMPTGSATTPATTKQQSAPTFTQSGATITANVAATSVSVTPTVVPGYVASGTAGTITMSANSATYTIPTQTKSATANGTVNPDSGYLLSSVNVNVPQAIPIDISTDAGMAAVLTAENVGKCYRFTGTTGTYTNGNLYVVIT